MAWSRRQRQRGVEHVGKNLRATWDQVRFPSATATSEEHRDEWVLVGIEEEGEDEGERKMPGLESEEPGVKLLETPQKQV